MCVAQDVFYHYALSLGCVDARQDKKNIVCFNIERDINNIYIENNGKKLSRQLRERYGSINFNYIFN